MKKLVLDFPGRWRIPAKVLGRSFSVAWLVVGCASDPVLPEPESIEVSRRAPDERCIEMGPVTGRTMSVQATAEQALEAMKKEAADKGANYVQVMQYSGAGTAVTGIAYRCR